MIAALLNAPLCLLPTAASLPAPTFVGSPRAMLRMVTGEAPTLSSVNSEQMHERLMELSAAMRERELAKDAASVVSEMQLIDVTREVNRAVMAKTAAAVVTEMDLIDAQNELRQAKLAQEAAVISGEMQAARYAALVRQNHELTTQLRQVAPGRSAVAKEGLSHVSQHSYYGRPFSHSLKLFVAHGRDVAITARLDLLWQLERVRYRFQVACRHLAFRAMVLKIRYGLRLHRALGDVKARIADATQSAAAQQPAAHIR